MIKDYLPIEEGLTEAEELERIERQWTAIWQECSVGPAPALAGLCNRDEYRCMKPHLAQLGEPGKLKVLDGGCGTGEWVQLLSEEGFDVHGVDISQYSIELLQKKFSPRSFSRGDIRQLDFPDEHFNAYYSWGVFEHFEEGLQRCLGEAHRVLKPGGLLFVSVPFHNRRHWLRGLRPLHKQNAAYNPQTGFPQAMGFYQWRLTKAELEQELAIAGFRVRELDMIHFQTGLSRMIILDLGMKKGSRGHRLASRLLRWFIPQRWVAHMLLAVAEKSTGNMEH